MVVIHHDPPQTPSPGALCCHHLLRERDRQWPNCLNGESAREAALRIGLIEFFRQRVGGRRFYIRTSSLNRPNMTLPAWAIK